MKRMERDGVRQGWVNLRTVTQLEKMNLKRLYGNEKRNKVRNRQKMVNE